MTATSAVTMQDLAGRVAHAAPPSFTLTLCFGDYGLTIASNCAPVLEKLRCIYRSFVADAPAGRVMTIVDGVASDPGLPAASRLARPIEDDSDDEVYDLPDARIIWKRSKGILFASGDSGELAILPCGKHGDKLVNFINSRYIQWQLYKGGVLAHASSVRSERKGLVVTGSASAGKTTLAFRLLDAGSRLVGKDNLIVRREHGELRMYGTPAPPRVNPGTALHNPRLRPILDAAYAEKLERLSTEELWEVGKKHEVAVEELYGPGATAADGPADGIVVLNWHHGAGATRIERVSLAQRADLLRILMKPRGVFYRPASGFAESEPDTSTYLDVLGDCPAYEITGGIDFEHAATYCAGLL